MASIAHLAAGAVCGAAYASQTRTKPVPAIAVFALIALTPDLDFFAAPLPSVGTPLEHRVMTHSLPFAVAAGMVFGVLLGPRRSRLLAGVWSAVALASHGLLDAMTGNDPGPQLWWPFASHPVQFAWQPIPGTHSYQEYFTTAAIPVVSEELLWCLPFVALTGWILLRGRPGDQPEPEGIHDRGELLLGGRTAPFND